MKYKIESTGKKVGNDTEIFAVFNVRCNQYKEYGLPEAHVWYSVISKKARCAECSTPMVAMSMNCPHAKAVKRFKAASE